MAAPIDIVIPAFNQLHYCQQCVSTILQNTTRPYRLILVDNGSTDGVAAFFDSVPDATVIHHETNRGFAGGVNAGIAASTGDVLLLNSDTLVPKGWLEQLENALYRDPSIGIAGPMSNCVSGAQEIPGLDFANMEEIDAFAARHAQSHLGQWKPVERLVGFCMLIRRAVVNALGGFDESFGIGNFEDDDYCLRARRAGWQLAMAEDAFVFHYGNRTFAGMGIAGADWDDLMGRNQRYFIEKWTAAVQDDPERVAVSLAANREAQEAWRRGDAAEALRHFLRAIEAAPNFEINYNDFGAVLWELGERGRAYEQFARALRLRPKYVEARTNLLSAAAALDRMEDARALLREIGGDLP